MQCEARRVRLQLEAMLEARARGETAQPCLEESWASWFLRSATSALDASAASLLALVATMSSSIVPCATVAIEEGEGPLEHRQVPVRGEDVATA